MRRSRSAAAIAAGVLLGVLAPALPGAASTASAPSPLQWAIAGPRLMVLPTGPIGSLDSARAFQPSVVRAINGSYLMYYTGSDGSRNRLLGAYSPDGIAWTKLPWAMIVNDGAGSPCVFLVGSTYRMWFESVTWNVGPLGYIDRIYDATSLDGVDWTIGGVVLDIGPPGAWDAGTVGDPWVVRGTDGVYRMYYGMWAANGSVAIGVATSTDLVTFTKWSGNPVLLPGPSGGWDDYAVTGPSVVSGTTWTMFYEGRRNSGQSQVGLATSQDGYHWVRESAPFLPWDSSGAWDSFVVGGPDFEQGATARLYYDGGSMWAGNQIGMVNLTAPSAGGPEPTILGLPTMSFVLLLAMVGIGVAGLALFVLTVRSGSRRR